MIYHWIIAVIAIALLFSGWVGMQMRANQEPCTGLADEATCASGSSCHGCARAAKATMMERY